MVLPPPPTAKMHNTTNTEPADPTTASTNDMVNTPPPLKEYRKGILRLMQRADFFCKHISKRLLSSKAPPTQSRHIHTH